MEMGKDGMCVEVRDDFSLTGHAQEQRGLDREMGLMSRDLEECDLILWKVETHWS